MRHVLTVMYFPGIRSSAVQATGFFVLILAIDISSCYVWLSQLFVYR